MLITLIIRLTIIITMHMLVTVSGNATINDIGGFPPEAPGQTIISDYHS